MMIEDALMASPNLRPSDYPFAAYERSILTESGRHVATAVDAKWAADIAAGINAAWNLRDVVKPFVDLKAQMPQSIKLIDPKLDGLTPVHVTVTKDQMKAAFSALSGVNEDDG